MSKNNKISDAEKFDLFMNGFGEDGNTNTWSRLQKYSNSGRLNRGALIQDLQNQSDTFIKFQICKSLDKSGWYK